MPRKILLTSAELVASARRRCDDKQLEVLDRHLSFGWNVSKVDGYVGSPSVVFLKLKRTNGTTALLCVMPGGRIERNVSGKGRLTVTLPR